VRPGRTQRGCSVIPAIVFPMAKAMSHPSTLRSRSGSSVLVLAMTGTLFVSIAVG